MALLIGFIFACTVAALIYLPFGWLALRIARKAEKEGNKNLSWSDTFKFLFLFLIGIYLAIKGFNFVMDGFLDGLSP